MPRFLKNQPAAQSVTAIIQKATSEIVLIAPFASFSAELVKHLEKAASKKIKITLVLGRKMPRKAELSALPTLPNVSLHFLEQLQACCYFNEQELVSTSYNLFDQSHGHSLDLGMSLTKQKDRKAYTEVRMDAISLISKASALDKTTSYSRPQKAVPAANLLNAARVGGYPLPDSRGFHGQQQLFRKTG